MSMNNLIDDDIGKVQGEINETRIVDNLFNNLKNPFYLLYFC